MTFLYQICHYECDTINWQWQKYNIVNTFCDYKYMLHIFQYKYFQFPVSLSAMTLRIDNHRALSALFGFDHPDCFRSPHSTQKTIPYLFLTSSFFKKLILFIVRHNMTAWQCKVLWKRMQSKAVIQQDVKDI